VATRRIPGFTDRRLTLDQPSSTLVELYPSAALPAAGAFDDPDWLELPLGARFVLVGINYTGGAAGGSYTLRPQWGFDESALGFSSMTSEGSVVAAEPYATRKAYAEQVLGPVVGAAEHALATDFRVPAGARLFRLLKAEVGAVGTPGTIRVRVSAYGL